MNDIIFETLCIVKKSLTLRNVNFIFIYIVRANKCYKMYLISTEKHRLEVSSIDYLIIVIIIK